MKRLAFLLFLLPSMAFAQVAPETYRLATPTQVQGFSTTGATSITAAILSRVIELTCTAACNLWVNVSGQSLIPTKSTGYFLPANTPRQLSVSPGSHVYVIGASGTGQLFVQELTK